MEDGEQSDMEGEEVPEVVLSASLEAKLQELLHYVTSTEIKLCADATKEFIKLLKSSSGGELLYLYVRTSSKCLELLEAWKLRQGKPGIAYVFLLISAVLSHVDGKYGPREPGRIAVARALDSFARLLIDEKLQDVYKELNSKESKRQKAALQLMASIVRRGSDMASEVAKKFDFTLKTFKKLAYNDRKKQQAENNKRKTNSVRMSFVGFAMSFLEVGRPGLLRWILQQKDMYSGVLRGLGNDEEETVVYVLSTLRDRILTEESLVPPGLRSVIFGSVTLEQMVNISGRENGGVAAELAHNVLIRACTDPSNGLMPDSIKSSNRLRGNHKRLLDLMKKLKATESRYHKDLLLALVRGRPSFGSAYLEEFPYNVEDHASAIWFSVISLAAEVVSSVGAVNPFSFLDSVSHDPPPFDGVEVQSIIKCACPRPFSRSNMNKGLLHSDILVKNGSLRLLLEELKLLDSFSGALERRSHAQNVNLLSWESLKREIQNEVRTVLPDPQVLLSLLSSQSGNIRNHESPMKRKADSENTYSQKYINHAVKKMKTSITEEDADIIVAGIASSAPTSLAGECVEEELDEGEDPVNLIAKIWGSDSSQMPVSTTKDVELYFCSKILDAIRIYLCLMPTALEGSFDFFVNLLGDASSLSMNLLGSILSLLKEYISCPPGSSLPLKPPAQMYKLLQPFINLLLFSPDGSIKDQAYSLSVASMLSTGAFDGNAREVDTWFLFLPSYNGNNYSADSRGVEALRGFSQATVSFLCDAVSTVGNNLFKFWEVLRCNASKSIDCRDCAADFGPLTICILQKCLRVLRSDSGSFPLPDKTMISLYVCNTLKYLLQTQVHAGLLPATIVSLISESIVDCTDSSSKDALCEWRPLQSLLLFAQSRLNREAYPFCGTDESGMAADVSFAVMLNHIEELVRRDQSADICGITRAFCSSIICTAPSTILLNFSSVITIAKNLHGVPISTLSQIFFIDESLLARISRLEPELFLAALEMVDARIVSKWRNQDAGLASPHSFSCEERHSDSISDASEPAAAAFSLFLYKLPFHVLFPAIMSLTGPFLSDSLGLYRLLKDKLFDSTVESLVSYMRLVLFWVHQLQLANVTTLSDEIIKLALICVGLLEYILKRMMFLGDNSVGIELSAYNIKEVARSIFSHPAVTESFVGSLDLSKEFSEENLSGSLNVSPCLPPMRTVSEVDNLVLKIVENTLLNFLSLSNPQYSLSSIEEIGRKNFGEAYHIMVKSLFMRFRELFDICIQNQTLDYVAPTFNAMMGLVCSLPPYELFELVHWIFNRVKLYDATIPELLFRKKALAMGCLLAICALENLITYMQQPNVRRLQLDVLWGVGIRKFDCNIVEEIYVRALEYAIHFDVDFANTCLLKALTVVYMERSLHHLSGFHPLSFFLSRVIARTPLEFVSDCIMSMATNEIRAKTLCLLVELSPLHLSLFGFKFSKSMPQWDDAAGMDDALASSSQCFLMLLPAALSFLNSISVRYGKLYIWHLPGIRFLYSTILLDGFHQWETFVSGSVFQEECSDWPSSVKELLEFSEGSLLGKAVDMLRYHLILDSDSIDLSERLELFDSVMPNSASHGELIDNDSTELESIEQSLNAINKFLAKISLCRILLFPEYVDISSSQDIEAVDKINVDDEIDSDCLKSSRIRLITSLVSTWTQVVKKIPLASDNTANGEKGECLPFWATERLRLYNYLEDLMVRSIQELIEKMRDDLVQVKSADFLGELVRSSLLYRFVDIKTLKMLQSILSLLSHGEFSYRPYLQLLLSHSQLPQIFHSISKSSDCLQLGAFLRPMSSILRSLVTPVTDYLGVVDENVLEKSKQRIVMLEVLKLLRTLLHSKGHEIGTNSEKGDGIDYQNLFFLLLSSYGATECEIDLELYNLILEIESRCSDSANLAEADFLWGSSYLKFHKELQLEQNGSSDIMTDMGSIEQRRRSQVRENFPVDPKLCANTVLYLHYKRAASMRILHSESTEMHEFTYTPEAHAFSNEKLHGYDPVYIMRFSLHVLSAGYVEPVEFASLGLLAVAFACLSSPDDGIRKLGYETLAKFKDVLEKSQKKKDVNRLRLLLNYVQNGIEEPWQRIPSIIGVFAAESSLVLLNPSHDHYAALNKLLLRSSRINMKSVPLFNNFLWSSAINFKSERMWILRLIYVALNVDDDSPIFINNSVFENLLSLFSCPVLDDESKQLLFQIVRKSVELPKLSRHLVEHCGLFSWLSSVLSFITGRLSADDKTLYTSQFVLILEVINTVILSGNITEWLQKSSLEQLAKISAYLFKFLNGSLKLPNGDTLAIDMILHILMFTQKISQTREMHQPHFTLVDEGIFQIYEVVRSCDGTKSTQTSEYGLRVILMTTPIPIFNMDQEKVSKFLEWAICTVRKSDGERKTVARESRTNPVAFVGDKIYEESLTSKLLRWLTASVIHGKLYRKSAYMDNKLPNGSNMKTLKSLLERIQGTTGGGSGKNTSGSGEEVLAAAILYLKQVLGINPAVVHLSVVSALCVLLLDSSCSEGPELKSLLRDPYSSLLLSKIRCPPEANPAWTWSYDEAWKDPITEEAYAEMLDKFQNCERLLVILSNKMAREFETKIDYFMYPEDIERNGGFRWEHRFPSGSEVSYSDEQTDEDDDDVIEDHVQKTDDEP